MSAIGEDSEVDESDMEDGCLPEAEVDGVCPVIPESNGSDGRYDEGVTLTEDAEVEADLLSAKCAPEVAAADEAFDLNAILRSAVEQAFELRIGKSSNKAVLIRGFIDPIHQALNHDDILSAECKAFQKYCTQLQNKAVAEEFQQILMSCESETPEVPNIRAKGALDIIDALKSHGMCP